MKIFGADKGSNFFETMCTLARRLTKAKRYATRRAKDVKEEMRVSPKKISRQASIEQVILTCFSAYLFHSDIQYAGKI